jgi:hypothetical protein
MKRSKILWHNWGVTGRNGVGRGVVYLLSVGLFLLLGLWFAGCNTGDAVEKGCQTDTDCYVEGEPQMWCEPATGICVAFTSPPGETTDSSDYETP